MSLNCTRVNNGHSHTHMRQSLHAVERAFSEQRQQHEADLATKQQERVRTLQRRVLSRPWFTHYAPICCRRMHYATCEAALTQKSRYATPLCTLAHTGGSYQSPSPGQGSRSCKHRVQAVPSSGGAAPNSGTTPHPPLDKHCISHMSPHTRRPMMQLSRRCKPSTTLTCVCPR